MSIKSASTMFGMPFGKNPRTGQREVFEKVISETNSRNLNVQLPTGYGKSFVNAGVYSILKNQGRVNRLLIIVPTTAQKSQFEKDGPADFKDACVEGDLTFIDVGYFGMKECIKRHRNNKNQIFITTPQAMVKNAGDIVRELMMTGQWMVTADEYHHYGTDKSWGEAVKNLPYNFLLAMSATPYRHGNDSAFGTPNLKTSYRDAVEEKAVKKLMSHSYIYRLDLLDSDNNIQHMTTCELAQAAKSEAPEAVEKFIIERQMRWSPKYVSPLVVHPIERLLRERIKTGYKLQAIVGAMCVSHAKLVCEQIRKIFPDLSVDWVGTINPSHAAQGIETGRPDAENRAVLDLFCPPKDENGQRTPKLDVLVHVGMAGEGLDSVHVSEVIHLNKASINNSNNQENGRAARFLEGVIGNVNFDSSSEYATNGYIGYAIMDAMDMEEPKEPTEDEKEEMNKTKENNDYEELPEKPTIRIWNMELESIDSGLPEVERATRALVEAGQIDVTEEEIKNPESEIRKLGLTLLREKIKEDCEAFDEKAKVEQWSEAVKNALRVVSGLVVKYKMKTNGTIEKSYPGDVSRIINMKKKKQLGEISKNIKTYERHYDWLKQLEQNILKYGPPSWMP